MILVPFHSGRAADPLAYLIAVELGHHHVQQQQIRRHTVECCQRLLAVAGDRDLEPGAAHEELERHDDVGLVVDHQHPFAHFLSLPRLPLERADAPRNRLA